MDPFLIALIASGGGVVASSGFWAWVQGRDKTKSATVQLLLGVSRDRIIFLGMQYIKRGWITKDEYDDFERYLYRPYSHFGGNGMAERIMDQVKQLPFSNQESPVEQTLREREQ